ncbi:MAG: class I SAM-dependent rRNA methyltransferase [Deltaproteobacteria bacterium]|nr:class I SAM-dependent rRNA methyltransferase [Deltaproteobacteria bacterium]MBW2360101.1 class I SAM-dependent rRNA methyltransferase [Deltaproteobacteria bacterium]
MDVILHAGRERSVLRRHPWILSGAVANVAPAAAAQPGAWVRVLSHGGEVLGFGYLSPASQLRVRLVAFGKDEPAEGWLAERIAVAVARRNDEPLLRDTDAVRLVNAEGDGLPGLVADRYGDVVVVKLMSAGMLARRESIANALCEATGAAAGYERPDAAAARREGMPTRQGVLWGELPSAPVPIREGRRCYRVDCVDGQKTGFYLDQRDARDLVERLADGRRMLDLFAYTGGFSVAAAVGGARSVTAVDSSQPALALAAEHLEGRLPADALRLVRQDAFGFVREDEGEYDLIVVDPPPLARNRGDVRRAARAYKDVTLHALRRASPGARLLAFSCSHHMGAELFRKVIFGASVDAARPLRVLAQLGQPVDHAVALDHPEGAYLTGFLLEA